MQRSTPKPRLAKQSAATKQTAKRTIRTMKKISPKKALLTRSTRKMGAPAGDEEVKHTALYDAHVVAGGKMVPFCGYSLPVQYKDSLIDSHKWVRSSAGLFDVSHMGQTTITGKKRVEFIESLSVCDVQGLKVNNAKLTVFTNENGGVIDDCIVTKRENDLYIVLNAGCKDKDMAHINKQLKSFNDKNPSDEPVVMTYHDKRSLVALQGPKAAGIMAKLMPDVDFINLPFMGSFNGKLRHIPVSVARCGYTGEDGFEIGCEDEFATDLWNALLEDDSVRPAGLGVRDSLRLEAGLCLYGHELDENTTPIDAGLKWLVAARCETPGSFLGSEAIIAQIAGKNNNKRLRGIEILGGAPARHGATLHDLEGKQVGVVTSGGPAPSLEMKKIALGYLDEGFWKAGTEIQVSVRGKMSPAVIKPPSFYKGNYYRVPTTQ